MRSWCRPPHVLMLCLPIIAICLSTSPTSTPTHHVPSIEKQRCGKPDGWITKEHFQRRLFDTIWKWNILNGANRRARLQLRLTLIGPDWHWWANNFKWEPLTVDVTSVPSERIRFEISFSLTWLDQDFDSQNPDYYIVVHLLNITGSSITSISFFHKSTF